MKKRGRAKKDPCPGRPAGWSKATAANAQWEGKPAAPCTTRHKICDKDAGGCGYCISHCVCPKAGATSAKRQTRGGGHAPAQRRAASAATAANAELSSPEAEQAFENSVWFGSGSDDEAPAIPLTDPQATLNDVAARFGLGS